MSREQLCHSHLTLNYRYGIWLGSLNMPKPLRYNILGDYELLLALRRTHPRKDRASWGKLGAFMTYLAMVAVVSFLGAFILGIIVGVLIERL